MTVPFLDLSAQYHAIETEISQAIDEILLSHAFIKGPSVTKFENMFAEYLHARHCVGVANGTDAIFLTLKALGVGPGDQVITVPNTFIATTEMITATGADIVWADIDTDTYLMDINSLDSLITEKTKVILPVLLYGNAPDMEKLAAYTKTKRLHLVVDAAQAHGAKWNTRNITDFVDAATYSFYPGKNLGAYGDAGAVVTNNSQTAESVRMFADHGRKDKYIHQFEGYSSRLDSLQASILSVKLAYLDKWNSQRHQVATSYSLKLQDIPELTVPTSLSQAYHVYHLYVIKVQEHRDQLAAYLKERGIQTGVHYPLPLPFQPAYANKTSQQDRNRFSYVKQISDRILSLPIFPEISEEQVDSVCNAIHSFFESTRR
jgi:dTDP-4-amino-4,6-dideoxygalactose transaminase